MRPKVLPIRLARDVYRVLSTRAGARLMSREALAAELLTRALAESTDREPEPTRT